MILAPKKQSGLEGPDKNEGDTLQKKGKIFKDIIGVTKANEFTTLEINRETNQQIDEIKKDKPFSSLIDYNIADIQRIYRKGAKSGEVRKIKSNDNEFKLRKCKKIEDAERLESTSYRYGTTLPTFYGREGKYLLFKWIKNIRNRLEYNKRDRTKKIGELLGKINGIDDNEYSKEVIFRSLRGRFREGILTFTPDIQTRIIKKLKDFKSNPSVMVGIDLQDTKPENIIFDDNNDIYCIDEGAIKPGIKGLGIGKIIKYKDNFSPKDFCEGYKRYHNIELNKGFIEGIFLIALLKKIQQKIEVIDNNFHNYNVDYSLDQKYILDILNGTTKYINKTSFPEFIQYIETTK